MSKILIVDDEKDMCWTLSKFLEKHGYVTVSVQNGDAALEKVKTEPLRLVLLDIQMPGKDGLKVLDEIRRIDKGLPVVLITGYGSPEVAARAIQLGASDYLSKPFDNRTLLEIVKKHEVSSAARHRAAVDEIRVMPEPLARKLRPHPDEQPSPEIVDVTPSEPESAPQSAASEPAQEEYAPHKEHTLRKIIFTALLVGGAVALVMRVNEFQNPFSTKTRVFNVGHGYPSALTAEANAVWTANWFDQILYLHDAENMSVLKSFPLSGIRAAGLVWAGSALYIADSWKKQIVQLQPDAAFQTLKIVSSYTSPGPSPSGICFDGQTLWTCDQETAKIYRHRMDAALSVSREYNAPGRTPIALAWDGAVLWSMDGSKETLYRHRMDDTLSVEASYSLKNNFPDAGKVSGFQIDRKTLWVLAEEPPALYRKDISFRLGSYIPALQKDR